MGRELKRVALDFQWPHDTVWQGYLNPYYKYSHACPHCKGNGNSPEAQKLSDRWYGYTTFHPEDNGSVPYTSEHPIIRERAERNVARAPEFYGRGEAAISREARRLRDLFNSRWSHHLNAEEVRLLVEAGRLTDFTSTFVPGEGWKRKADFVMPSAQEVNDWSLRGMGHDSSNQWILAKAVCEKMGASEYCQHCDGEGSTWESPEYEKLADEWVPEEPPAGEGYQIWQTVSEGSPISPVFATPEELASHMAGRAWGADHGSSYESWMNFIVGPGWAPSMVIDSQRRLHTGPITMSD